MAKGLNCEACGAPAQRLGQRDTDGLMVCPGCTPESTWAQYPGARERTALREKRAQTARRNFGHVEADHAPQATA